MAINRSTVTLTNSAGTWNITDYVLSVNISVGKSRQLDTYQPGNITVVLKNFNREFDPLNTSSSFYGSVLPRNTDIYVTLAGGGTKIFEGVIDDFSFDYNVSSESTVTIAGSEYSSLFANQTLLSTSFPQQYSGARAIAVLQDTGVAYSTAVGAYVIGNGTQLLDADTTPKGTNALDYLKNIEVSEQGNFYYNQDGTLWFDDNNYSITSPVNFLFSDDGTAGTYPYTSIDISYSSQLLYNQITLASNDNIGNRTVTSPSSITTYRTSQLTVDGVLYNDSTRLDNLGAYYLSQYAQPEYRINSVRVNFAGLSDAQQNAFATYATDLNYFCKVRFKPNNIGTAIDKYVKVIGLEHSIMPSGHEITFMFESIRIPKLVLDDSEFGKLDTNQLGL